jgi:hypothetical protein
VQQTATAAEWATVEKLRAKFPDAIVMLMVQRLRYRTAPAAAECREVFVAVARAAGPITVRRQFRV